MTACERALAPDVDAVIAVVPEPQRSVVVALRALLREAAPGLEESVKWGKPVYGRGTANLLSIIAHRSHVNLQVFDGATLCDPDGLLEGTGRSLRHVKCRMVADVARPGVRALVERAASVSPLSQGERGGRSGPLGPRGRSGYPGGRRTPHALGRRRHPAGG